MSEQLTWWVGDRNPAYADTITVNGVPVDLTAATAVTFKMRAVNSSTLKVNQPVTTKDATGNFTYAWDATDLDTASQYLVWVEVTTAGKTQTLFEDVIAVRAHSNVHNYIELEQLKSTADLTGTSFADQDLLMAIGAASRAIDFATGRRFWLDAGTANVRIYTPEMAGMLRIDDLAALTSVRVARTSTGSFDETWANGTEFVLEPRNAVADGKPWEFLSLRPYGNTNVGWYGFPVYPNSVEITGQFGWPAVPDDIRVYTSIIATKLTKRMREAAFGVAGIGFDGAAVRIARFDPDVSPGLANYSRKRLLV